MQTSIKAGFALTEPEGGTDLGSISTTALKDDDEYIINGVKTWITNAPVADFFTVLCLTDKSKGLKGANFFLVERDNPGLSVSKKFDKLGTHGAPISELILKDCRIPAENMLGEEGRGIGNLMRILSEIRGMTAALSLGLARAAYDESLKYVKQANILGQQTAGCGRTLGHNIFIVNVGLAHFYFDRQSLSIIR